MAGQDSASCYSCEGTLLVPTVNDQVSNWQERLVSGNRMTIILKVVGQRWSSDACFLLWGENYLQEKVFEVNLRYVRGYFVRTRTWHEITSSDRRRFALSFQDSNQFARFYEELESTLSFLKKLVTTTAGTAGDPGGIVVLRVDKLPPPKPPRSADQAPSSPVEPPPLDAHRVPDRQPQYPDLIGRAVRGGSTETKEEAVSDEEQTTKWYVDICDSVTTTPQVSKRSDNYSDGIYETIAEPMSSPQFPNELNTGDAIDPYDNIRVHGLPCAAKPNKSNACNISSGEGSSTADEPRVPAPRKPIESPIYDDRDSCDYFNTDFIDSQPVVVASKPRLPPRSNGPTGNKPSTTGVTNDSNRGAHLETGRAQPQPLPRPKKPTESKSSPGDDWTCSQCTLINPTTTDRCAACDKARHESLAPPVTGSRDISNDDPQPLPPAYIASFTSFPTADEKWTCSVCSARNRRLRESNVCDSCTAWVCSHCTLHNQPDQWVCIACSHSRLLQ